MVLRKLFKQKPEVATAQKMYLAIVKQSRRPEFYLEGGVADTIDGRFDLLVLNVYLVIRRLNGIGESTKALSQALFDEMFKNLDGDLREMGIGDMGISKKVQKMAEAFYGRVDSYQKALEHKDDTLLKEALVRNLFRSREVEPRVIDQMHNYIQRQIERLDNICDADLLQGDAGFENLSGSSRDLDKPKQAV